MSDIPAGWQPDPRGRHEYRYWDGTQWTDHVSNQGEVSSDPVADATPAAASGPATSEPAATEVQPVADTAHEPEPVVADTSFEREPEHEPVRADTTPEPVIDSEPEPVVARPDPVVSEPVVTTPTEPAGASAAPTAASAAPPGGPTTPSTSSTEAKAAAQDMLHSKSPELATILSVIAPGSGHFYMGAANAIPVGVGLLVATVVAVVLAYMSFILFVVGFVIWLAAAAFALQDLRGGVKGIENTTLPPNIVGILLIGAGLVLVVSLFLPYYHVKVSAGGFSASGNGSGWEVFGIEDIILFVIGIGAIVAGAASLGLGPVTAAELPRQLPLAVAIGGAIAVLILLFRMFVDSAPSLGGSGFGDTSVKIGRAPGMLLAMDAALVLLIANLGVLRSLTAKKDRQAV